MPAQALAETCQGKPATIVQAEGIVEGTDGDDVIVGGVETKVRAGEGDDTICVTGGRVEGGDGDDSAEMRGTDGADFVELRNVEDVDVDTAGGPDHVRLVFHERFGGSVGSIDEGDGLDILSVVLTRSGTNIYLPRGFVETSGGHTLLDGAENVFASGRWVRIYGNRADNKLWADGCRVTMIGGDGDDALSVFENHWITKAAVIGSSGCAAEAATTASSAAGWATSCREGPGPTWRSATVGATGAPPRRRSRASADPSETL